MPQQEVAQLLKAEFAFSFTLDYPVCAVSDVLTDQLVEGLNPDIAGCQPRAGGHRLSHKGQNGVCQKRLRIISATFMKSKLSMTKSVENRSEKISKETKLQVDFLCSETELQKYSLGQNKYLSKQMQRTFITVHQSLSCHLDLRSRDLLPSHLSTCFRDHSGFRHLASVQLARFPCSKSTEAALFNGSRNSAS